MESVQEQIQEGSEEVRPKRLNQWVAISVTIIAVFMALAKVKDDNIVQSMVAAQARELDQWNQFQAKSTKQHLYEVQMEQWGLEGRMAAPTLSPSARGELTAQLAKWKSEISRYDGEKADLQKAAQASRAEYDGLNFRDDQFDFSDALLGLAIALFAVSSLTGSRALFGLGWGVSTAGLVMGLAGFFGWLIHPSVIRFLT